MEKSTLGADSFQNPAGDRPSAGLLIDSELGLRGAAVSG